MSKLIAWLRKTHIIHTWGRWEKYQVTSTPLANGIPIPSLAIEVTRQRTKCERCGKQKSESL